MTSDAPLVDISGVAFDMLTGEDNQQIVRAMKRVVDSVNDDGVLSAFNSALEFGSAITP